MSKNSVFSNPDNLPLEAVTLSVNNVGVIKNIKALDSHWVDKRDLSLYEKPPYGKKLLIGAVDGWKSRSQAYLQDIKWLLGLEHHRFWSTILHHPQCMDMLVSFLQEAFPPYLPPHEDIEVQNLYSEIRRLVLIVFSRLITNKENKLHWMTKEHMADVLYNNFIFTIPIVWDLCLVYGVDNSSHVARLLDSLFTLQPRYEADAAAGIAFVNEAFKYIILQVNNDYDSEEPPNLPETFKGFSEIRRPSNSKQPDKLTIDVLKDLVIHLLDTAMTLRIFVETYPKCVHLMRKTNFVNSIVQLYEYGIPLLYEKLEDMEAESSAAQEIENYVDMSRAELIDVFREILAFYKNAIFSGEGSLESNVENYLSVMMDGLSEKLLIQDYHACYPVNEDLELLKQAYPDIDTVKTDFILQAIYSNLDEPVPESHPTLEASDFTNGHLETTDEATPPRDTEIPDNIREESLITEVKDIFPELGDGFVLKCLKHYGFNSERVINSILEDNLAKPLRGLDRSLPIIPEDILDQKFLETGIQRLNVFDGDQFDIMSRDDVDLSKIHVGKKREKYRDLKQMLDDKTEVKKLADVYSKYNLVCDEVDMYSDEYDDTYDSDGVVPTADQVEDARRPFVTPRALRTKEDNEEVESSSEEEVAAEPAVAGSSRNRMDFCSNPAEIRERREAYRAQRGRGAGRPTPNRSADVVGKPKGHGQEKEVLHNREKKEKHKSSRGNHNRRQGAQWKRTQGLVPS